MSGIPVSELLPKQIPVNVSSIRWLGWNALVLAVYWAVLVFSYVHSVAPTVGTATFLYLRPNLSKEIESVLWGAVLLPTVNTNWTRPSDFGLTLFYYVGFVPTLIIFGLADQPRMFMYPMIAGYLALYLVCRSPIKIPAIRIKQAGKASLYISSAVVGLIFLWFFAKGSWANFNVDLSAVYGYREEAGSIFPGPLAYLSSWVPRFLNPFLLCYFLYRKRWFLFLFCLGLQVACLGVFQEKAVFIPCVMLAMLYIAPSGWHARIWLVLSLVATVVVCEAIFIIYDLPFFMEVWTRRFFFVQQFLYFNYFDVFGKLGLIYYSDSFLKGLIHYPFKVPSAQVVAYYAWGDTLGSPNTGFLGSGYMELGDIGVVLNGAAAGLVFKLFDRVVPPGMPVWFFSTVAFLPFMALTIDQNLVTSMLTGGVFILLLLMACTGPMKEALPRRSRASDDNG